MLNAAPKSIRPIDLASTGAEAIPIVNEFVDAITTTLQRRFGIPISEIELALADDIAAAKRRLRDALRDRVHIKDLPEDF